MYSNTSSGLSFTVQIQFLNVGGRNLLACVSYFQSFGLYEIDMTDYLGNSIKGSSGAVLVLYS